MTRNRFFALLTALCLLIGMVPVHAHASHTDPLDALYHARHQWRATHQVQTDRQGKLLVRSTGQALLPAGDDEFLISNTLEDNCRWGIADDGFLYIWCDGEMPTRGAGQYPWSVYKELYTSLYVDSATVADNAFADCDNLSLVILEESVTNIGQNAFAGCTGLEEFWFYGTAPFIADNAFTGTETHAIYHFNDASFAPITERDFGGDLTWVTWVEAIDGGMFGTVEWTVYEDMTLQLQGTGSPMQDMASAEEYPWSSWQDEITYVECSRVTRLSNYALADFTALTYAYFDQTLTAIGSGAFQGCAGMTLCFTGNAPTLGVDVFSSDALSLEYPQDNPTWTTDVVDLFYGKEPGDNELPPDDGPGTTLPDDSLGENQLPSVDIPPETPGQVTCGITSQQVYDAMMALQPQYPEGMHWTNDDYYAWNGGYFSGGYGCAGFAFILSDAAFGTEPCRLIEDDVTIADIRVGDILRINNDTHSVIVLEVHESHVVIAEGNFNSSIHWGRTLSADTIASTTDYIMTRYPEHSWSSGSCLEPRSCQNCGYAAEAPGHTWLAASCTAPRACSVCGFSEGEPAGHTYTDDADNSCNVCGFLRDVGQQPAVTIPLSAFELEVLRLTNLERLAAGLTPLTATEALQQATDIRADEVKAYFNHTRPNGTSCFTVLDELGIPYHAAAENIASGYQTPAAVVVGWMNSDGHRKNILNPALGHMGVGESGRAWVQLFTDAPAYTAIRVDVPENTVITPGTAIDDLGLVAVLRNSNGDCWLPLASAFCSGYDPNAGGTQTVTVSVLGVTCTFTVSMEGHTHTWVEATCETPRTCPECGKAEGAPLGHNWQAAACEAPKTCTTCGKTEGALLDHNWQAATCEAPKTCTTCGKAEGAPLGHNWQAATCEAPKTCTTCGKAEGAPLGHSYTGGVCSLCGRSQYSASGRLDTAIPTREQIAEAFQAVTSADSVFDLAPSVTAPYSVGKLSDSMLQSAITYLNFIRFVANLPAQQLDSTLNEDAQYAAALNAANDVMSHYPEKPADMDDAFFNRGYAGASSSNLCSGYGSNAANFLQRALQSFMDDNVGLSNLQKVGHRRWVLNPILLNVGFGQAASADGTLYMAMKVFDQSGSPVDYDFVAWPANNFPTNLFDTSVPWSVSLNPSKYATPNIDEIQITLTRRSDGKVWTFDSTTGEPSSTTQPYLVVETTGYGSGPCIIFHPGSSNIDPYSGVYDVRITGLKDRTGTETEVNYIADFFSLEAPHKHSYTAQVTAPTCTERGFTVYVCACGHSYTDAYTDPLGHNWQAATCEAAKFCTRCGLTEGSALGHNWTDTTCETPKTCTVCGLTEGSALGHNWNAATCETPKTCTVCGKTDGSALGHDWADATCIKPRFCNRCGRIGDGSFGDHNWIPATCQAPKTCSVCGTTEGEPGAHSWDSGIVTLEPTPEADGLKTYTCQACGATQTEPIPATLAPFVSIEKPDSIASKYDLSYEIPQDGATVLIFFSSQCGKSISLMSALNDCPWLANPWLNVVAVESKIGTEEAIAEFRDTYTPDVADCIHYMGTTNNHLVFDYFRLFSNANTLTWPLVLVITGSAESPVVRFGSDAMTDAAKLEEVLNYVSPAFAGWDGTVHQHTWVDATCQAPKTCSECGVTEGEPIGHSFQNGICAMCGLAEIMRGDANGNGTLDYDDALKVLRASISLETLPENVVLACDVNSNGALDFDDALLILRASIGLITEFPKTN